MQSNFKISNLQKIRSAPYAPFYGIEFHLMFSVLTIFHDLNSEKIYLSKTQSLKNSEAKTFREFNFPQLKVLGDLHSYKNVAESFFIHLWFSIGLSNLPKMSKTTVIITYKIVFLLSSKPPQKNQVNAAYKTQGFSIAEVLSVGEFFGRSI